MSLGVIAASAQAESASAWYRVSSLSLPTNLASGGGGANEVQELSVSATKGFVFVSAPTNFGKSAIVKYDASAGELREALEGALERRVLVQVLTAGAESHSWKITFPDQAVEPFFANGGEFVEFFGHGKEPLSCEGATGVCTGEATVVVLSKGTTSGHEIVVNAINVGDALAGLEAAAGGVPATIVDALPAGLEALSIEGGTHVKPGTAHCVLRTLTCVFTSGVLAPFVERLEVFITVNVLPAAASGEVNTASVSGGESFACHEVASGSGKFVDSGCVREAGAGSFERVASGAAPAALVRRPLSMSSAATPFGVEDYEVTNEEVGGRVQTHAGAHPFQTTFTLNLNETLEADGAAVPAALAKDLTFELPAGFIGDPSAYPRCSLGQFSVSQCPAASIIGVATVLFHEPTLNSATATSTVSIYNLEPSVGEPARFGLKPAEVPVFIDTSVRTGGDYGITAHVQNVPQTVGFLANSVTFWGVPGAAAHDDARGTGCLEQLGAAEKHSPCTVLETSSPPPFLSLPTSCQGPLKTSVQADSWTTPGAPIEPVVALMPGMDGCGSLQFGSEISVTPDVSAGSTPSGLKVDVHVPQEEALNAEGYAPADVRNITVTLPEGLQLNPSAADGLDACSLAQIGFKRENPETHVQEFERQVYNPATEKTEASACPNSAKIATATIKTPLLPVGQYVKGFLYLAAPQNFHNAPPENPFSSLVAMYLVAEDPISGTIVKLPGSVSLSESGQITATFANNPQLPFEDAELEFFGGERAPLATPARCGAYTTSASFEPWTNNGGSVDEVLHSSSTFHITSGPNGSPCPGSSLPFNASLASGTTNNNAGGFSALTTTLSRPSGDQNIQSVTLHYPAGVSGLLSGVKLCPEAQANAGTCGPESQIGETIVSVGVGGEPFTVTGGKAYITGPYQGAPFGLSIVNPAKAGPFDLQEGRPVVVRAKIEVDPHTAALTITTNGSGQYAIPSIIEGFALQIQHVNVTINRPGFTFNPTNCAPTEITGQVESAEGATSSVKEPFQATNCASLKFAPKFAASTQGKTSKAQGASLHVDLTYPQGPMGTYANIKQVKVELPKQLPSELKTLQKACTAKQFDTNPAGCPKESIVGMAKAITPLIPVPLEGPAYFVSNGSEAFPNLIVVLQGYGVTIDLVGDTFISKAGITSSTFKTVPDQPVGSFELTLPEQPFSALAANGSLCTEQSSLKMPTDFIAQNGAELKQDTQISVTGCKPTITVKSHKVKGKTATIAVSVPAAGKLVASGRGLSKASKTAKGAGTLTVKLTLTKAETAVLAKHKGRKLAAKVKLTFTPKKGSKLKTSVTVLIG